MNGQIVNFKFTIMFHYLYYKLYQASLRSSLYEIPRIMTAVSFGVLVDLNVLVISAFLAKIDVLPFLFSSPIQGSFFAIGSIILTGLYFYKKRIELILNKYSQENNRARIKGNIIVSIYVAISFLAVIVVAFFRPGKL